MEEAFIGETAAKIKTTNVSTHIEEAFVSPIDAEIVELAITYWPNQLPGLQKPSSRQARARRVIRLKYY